MTDAERDAAFMRLALAQAQQADRLDEVPVGAILVRDGVVIGQGFNQPIGQHDPTAHAEVQCLRDAGRHVANYRLPGTTLYVTVEPCAMCFGALVHARVERLVYGTPEPKAGAVVSGARLTEVAAFNHQITVLGGVLEDECRETMVQFFQRRREAKKTEKDMKQDNPASKP